MDAAIHRLRSEARQLARGKGPTGVRYPDGFRDGVVRLVRTRHGLRPSVARLAKTVGVSRATLTRWVARPVRPVLRRVAVAADPRLAPEQLSSNVVVVTPMGVRVEGLDRDGLIAVLRALQ